MPQSHRLALSPAALHAILQSEYRRRRLSECQDCKVASPVFTARPDRYSANWTIEIPAECPHRCRTVILEILAEVAAKYDVKHAEPA